MEAPKGVKLDKARLLDAIYELIRVVRGGHPTLDRASIRGEGVLGVLGTCRFIGSGECGLRYLLRVTDDAGTLRLTLDELYPTEISALQVSRWGGVLGGTSDFVTGVGSDPV